MAKSLAEDLSELRTWLSMEQPYLSVSAHQKHTEISGAYLVKSNLSERAAFGPLERYEISVKVFNDHPDQTPELRETAGVILRDDKKRNHVNPNGSLCYGPPALTWASRPDMSLIQFFDEYVRSYFLGYLHYDKFDHWPKGEYAHGNEGVIDSIAELLGCKPNLSQISGLLNLLQLKHRRDRWTCPCGSKKRLGNCCRQVLNKASNHISRSQAIRLLQALKSDYH